jgi:hypothetical protein
MGRKKIRNPYEKRSQVITVRLTKALAEDVL